VLPWRLCGCDPRADLSQPRALFVARDKILGPEVPTADNQASVEVRVEVRVEVESAPWG